jgi:hypothetical protein
MRRREYVVASHAMRLFPSTKQCLSRAKDKDAVWIEVVESFGSANARLKQLAAERPGPYFAFSLETGTVVASIDTTNGGDAYA